MMMSRPVSFSEEVLLRIESGEPGAPAFNDCPRSLAVAAWLRGPCDTAILERSIDQVVDRHEVLRSTFEQVDRGFVKYVADHQAVRIERVDVAADCGDDQSVRQLMVKEARRPFSLAAGPLFRAQVFRHNSRDVAFLFTVHHLVFDAWSIRIWCREVSLIYGALSDRTDAKLPPLSRNYDDYVTWQSQHLDSQAVSHWHERMARRHDHGEPRSIAADSPCEVATFTITAEIVQALRDAAKVHRVTFAMMLCAGYARMVAHVLGGGDVTVGVPVADRLQPEFEGLIGLFMNVLVVHVDARVEPAAQLIAQVRAAFSEAYRDRDVPYGYCVRQHASAFDCIFDFVDGGDQPQFSLPGVQTEPVAVTGELILRSAMALRVSQASGALRGTLLYRSTGDSTMAGPELIDQLTRCLTAIASHPANR